MEKSSNVGETDNRVRRSTKQRVLEVLSEFKSDLAIDPETFDGDFSEFDDCPPIAELFEAAGMDRGNLAHWQMILLACSCCLFPESEDFSPKGRRTAWTDKVEDALIGWWFTAKREFGGGGVKALFEAMIIKYGPFRIGPSHVMADSESLRGRFQTIKLAAKIAVQNGTARGSQMRLIEALEMERRSLPKRGC